MKNASEKQDSADSKPARKPRGKPYKSVVNVQSASALGVGMIIGAVVGAGIALLVAPRTGREIRALLGSKAGRISRGPGVWYKLGKELKRAAAVKRKQLERQESRERVRDHASAQPVETV